MKTRRTSKTAVNRVTFGYARVSSETQADQGVSVDVQQAKILAYALAMGWDVTEVIRDAGQSAKTLQRPGMARILEAVRAGTVERVIISKLDRITRSTRDLADLLDLFAKHDVSLVSIGEVLDTGSAGGRLVVNMLLWAQWEREACGGRTAAALGHKRQQRTAYGKTPFGFDRQGNDLVANPREQAARTEALRMDKAGSSYREIGAFLATCTGKVWGPSSTRAMLRSRMATEAV